MRVPSTSFSRRTGRRFGWVLLGSGLVVLSGLPAAAGPLEDRFEEILRTAGPGIVRIDVRRTWDGDLGETPREAARSAQSLAVRRIVGNGVVWDADGRILTVSDLAQPGDTLRVFGANGTWAFADFLGQDPDIGISLIRVKKPISLRPIPRGAPSTMKARGWVLTLTCRSTSPAEHLALARLSGNVRRGEYVRMRIDGADDPGLAGGGVLDEEGRLIGLLLGEGSESLLLTPAKRRGSVEYCIRAGGPSEAGWLVPIDQAEHAILNLMQASAGAQGFLGVRVHVPTEPGPSLRDAGVVIAGVMPGSPAERAGIKSGDRLIRFDGEPIVNWDAMSRRVAAIESGRVVQVDILRDGKESALQVRLGDRGHTLWRQKQRALADDREKLLRLQIEGLRQQLELLRHQLVQIR